MPLKPLQVIATLTAQSGKADELRALLPDAVEQFRKEPGCQNYILLEDNNYPGRFITYETWADESALKSHMISQVMQLLQPKLKELLLEDIKQDFLTVLIDI